MEAPSPSKQKSHPKLEVRTEKATPKSNKAIKPNVRRRKKAKTV